MSVLIPLVVIDNRPSILFTKRSIHLRSHRGEVCFPGGRRDDGETITETALRETREEIGIDNEEIEIWGSMKSVARRQMDFNVTPIVAKLRNEQSMKKLKVNEEEVQAVFTAPIDELMKSAKYTKFSSKRIKYTLPVFESTQFKVHFKTKNDYLHRKQRVWGLTAVMLHQALTLIDPNAYKHDIFIKFF